MKFCLLTCALLATPALAQPKFDWKLRLTKGQTWTQTATTRTRSVQQMPLAGGATSRMEISIRQTFALKNEVLEVAPTYFLVRSTYTRFDITTSSTVNGKPETLPPMPQLDFVGVSFSMKQTPDGRVLDITGLEELVARQNKLFDKLAKTPADREALRPVMPSAATFKQSLIRSQSATLPQTPLAVGQSYAYALSLPVLASLPIKINGQRTLRAFDGQSARFDESGTINVAPTQFSGPSKDTVVLTRDAAQRFLAAKHRAKPGAGQVYLSRNGGIYSRDPLTHKAFFLDPPPNGIRIKREEAAPFRGFIGYNNGSTGKTIQSAFPGPGGEKQPRPASRNEPVTLQEPKTFVALNGTISGQSTIDATSGLLSKSTVTVKIDGKVSIVESNGTKKTVPLNSSTETTIETR